MPDKKKLKLYLAYPMEFRKRFDDDYWDKIAAQLTKAGFDVFNPCGEEANKTGMEFCKVRDLIRKMKPRITFDNDAKQALVDLNDKIWDVDLKAIDAADILLVYYDIGIVSDGTRREMYRMIDKGGIIYLVCPHKFEMISTVILASIIKYPENKLFHKMEYAVEALIKRFSK